eukprot:903136-Pelagomonas_calceolata.AAC.1
MHADMPELKKCERLPSDKQQISRGARTIHKGNQDRGSAPRQSNANLTLKVANWRTWAYTDGSCHAQNGKQETGAGVYCPLTDSKQFVEPYGAGITNTICRAELAATAAAITHSYANVASDSLTSFHQVHKQLLYPEKHLRHIQGDVLKMISTLISNSHTNICFYK